jgi:hypothetical protein
MSWRQTMLGCSSDLRIEISDSRFSISFLLSRAREMAFTATVWRETRCSPRKTFANEPDPIISSML